MTEDLEPGFDGVLDGFPINGFIVTSVQPIARGRVTFVRVDDVEAEVDRAFAEGRPLRDTITGIDRWLRLTDKVLGPELSFDWTAVTPAEGVGEP